MRLEVNVVKFVCEKCDREMHENDTFCYNCGNDLTKEISYKELTKDNVRLVNTGDWRGCL